MDGRVMIAVKYFCIQMVSTYLVPGTELYEHPRVIPQPLEAAAITPTYTRGNGGLVRLRNSAGGGPASTAEPAEAWPATTVGSCAGHQGQGFGSHPLSLWKGVLLLLVGNAISKGGQRWKCTSPFF